jgi:hypothetical protein
MNRVFPVLIAICGVAMIDASVYASTSYSISPTTLSAHPGDVGDSFDVLFTNSGPGSLSVAGFAFEVSVADPDITLAGADFSTNVSPYIFAGDSFDQINSLPLNYVNVDGYSPQILDASDVTNDSAGLTVASGSSVDLGRVLFNVASPAQAGQFGVSFTGEVTTVANANNLATPGGAGIAVDSFSGGTISVSAVPEPASLLLALLAVPVVGRFGRSRVRRGV